MTIRFSLSALVRQFVFLAPILLGVCLDTSPALAQGVEWGDASGAYVSVSREEVRVYFPPETSSAWGSAATGHQGSGALLSWAIQPEGMWGAATLALRFRLDTGSHTAPSLETIVREGRRELCREELPNGRCSSTGVNVSLENRRVVLSYRDTLEIRQMFGPRQATVPIFRITPEYLGDAIYRSVPVHYVDPPIVVDSAQRVALSAERRRREAGINSFHRTIASRSYDHPLWLVVGDVTPPSPRCTTRRSRTPTRSSLTTRDAP